MQAEAQALAQWLLQVLPAGASLSADSRSVKKGDAFFAYPGLSVDGRRFAQGALDAGAAAIVWDDSSGEVMIDPLRVPAKTVHQLKQKIGAIASAYLGSPSSQLDVIAFTGTSGKTSCATWYAQMSHLLGKPCALIGTRGAGLPDALESFGLTTPEAITLQQYFQKFYLKQIDRVAIEASSIALSEGRLNGTTIQTAVYTNLSLDHLDYHGTMQSYGDAKATLFAWPTLAHVVINIDDDAAGQMLAAVPGNVQKVFVSTSPIGKTSSATKRLFATNMVFEGSQVSLTIDGDFGQCETCLQVAGLFNVVNLLSVAACALVRGYALEQVVAALAQLRPIEGRMQTVGGHQLPLAVVDYAHKPDALEKVLQTLRVQANSRGGKLWCVFGCGGDRDTTKRPLMGAIAQKIADHVVVTSDNPRFENASDIIHQICQGVNQTSLSNPASLVIEADRQKAIALALSQADVEDVVLIAGKGHEAYQEISGVQYPFSDFQIVTELLQRRTEDQHTKVLPC